MKGREKHDSEVLLGGDLQLREDERSSLSKHVLYMLVSKEYIFIKMTFAISMRITYAKT